MPFRESLPLLAVDDPRKVVKVVASDGKTGDQRDLSYTNCKVVGNGSFGIVFQARLLDDTGNPDIAIKKVLQDKRFKNRELQIMRLVSHPNVVDLRAFFYSNGDKVSFSLTLWLFCLAAANQSVSERSHTDADVHQRKTKYTSTLCSNTFPKLSIALVATMPS